MITAGHRVNGRLVGSGQLQGESDLPLVALHHLVLGPDLEADSVASNQLLELLKGFRGAPFLCHDPAPILSRLEPATLSLEAHLPRPQWARSSGRGIPAGPTAPRFSSKFHFQIS